MGDPVFLEHPHAPYASLCPKIHKEKSVIIRLKLALAFVAGTEGKGDLLLRVNSGFSSSAFWDSAL